MLLWFSLWPCSPGIIPPADLDPPGQQGQAPANPQPPVPETGSRECGVLCFKVDSSGGKTLEPLMSRSKAELCFFFLLQSKNKDSKWLHHAKWILFWKCSSFDTWGYSEDRSSLVLPWQVFWMGAPPLRCSLPPRAPCCPLAGWSSSPGCWAARRPLGWCPSPPGTHTHTHTLKKPSSLDVLSKQLCPCLKKCHVFAVILLAFLCICGCTAVYEGAALLGVSITWGVTKTTVRVKDSSLTAWLHGLQNTFRGWLKTVKRNVNFGAMVCSSYWPTVWEQPLIWDFCSHL